MDIKSRCRECKTLDNDEFHKVLDLKNSGLVVYVHKPEEFLEDNKPYRKKNENYILHNIRHKDLKRPEFITELCQYRTKCFRCKTVVQKVRSLLDEISTIRGNEVLGVCVYCKKANPTGKCGRCLFVINKFCNNKAKQNEDRQIKLNTWLGKMHEFFESFMKEDEICRYEMRGEGSAAELQNLLEKLKIPLNMHEPDFELFATEYSQMMISQSKEMLEELLSKLRYRTQERFMSSFQMSRTTSDSTCICKHLKDNKFLLMPPLMETQKKLESLTHKETNKDDDIKHRTRIDVNENKSFDGKEENTTATKGVKLKKISKIKKVDKENKPPKEVYDPKALKESKPRKESLSSEEKLMLKMMKQREEHRKQTEKPVKKAKSIVLPKFKDLPPLKFHKVHVTEESSESIFECGDKKVSHPVEMVKGNKLVKYEPRAGEDDHSEEPLLFKTHPVCPEPVVKPPPPVATPILTSTNNMKKQKQNDSAFQMEINTKGLICYELSNRDFIDKGWTQLPTTKIMRRVRKELNAGQRYVIYSSGEEMDGGKLKSILASFDYLGNGVVYDHYGNMRLKYNQSEGVVIDPKIGPPGRWKWHTLNDPPVLQPAFLDTRESDPNPRIRELMKSHKDNVIPPKVLDQNMLSIERDNFLKEKEQKLRQKFKPFQIRTKVLKLNDKFSLRILDQANIHLMFRDGLNSLKLNLGMVLLNDEIIDTETIDVSDVATPYDRHPPRILSISDRKLGSAKKMKKTRGIPL